MSQTLHYIDEASLAFPDVSQALSDPNGLLAIGGDLSPQRLQKAYRLGIFPWFNTSDPVMWWSPTPRAIIPTSEIRINKTLRKFLKKCPYRVSVNLAFTQVIEKCACAPFRTEDTWIVDDMRQAYKTLHELNIAHSIEVWDDQELIGGLYGVAINGYFSGESMFYQKANASKVALVALAQLLKDAHIQFIDCQIDNPFLASMGAIEIPRDKFIIMKNSAIETALPSNFWQPRQLY